MALHDFVIKKILDSVRKHGGEQAKALIPEEVDQLNHASLSELKKIAESGNGALSNGHYEEIRLWALENSKITPAEATNGLQLDAMTKPVAAAIMEEVPPVTQTVVTQPAAKIPVVKDIIPAAKKELTPAEMENIQHRLEKNQKSKARKEHGAARKNAAREEHQNIAITPDAAKEAVTEQAVTQAPVLHETTSAAHKEAPQPGKKTPEQRLQENQQRKQRKEGADARKAETRQHHAEAHESKITRNTEAGIRRLERAEEKNLEEFADAVKQTRSLPLAEPTKTKWERFKDSFKRKKTPSAAVTLATQEHEGARTVLKTFHASEEVDAMLKQTLSFKPGYFDAMKEHNPEMLASIGEKLLHPTPNLLYTPAEIHLLDKAVAGGMNAAALDAARSSVQFLPTYSGLVTKAAELHTAVEGTGKALQDARHGIASVAKTVEELAPVEVEPAVKAEEPKKVSTKQLKREEKRVALTTEAKELSDNPEFHRKWTKMSSGDRKLYRNHLASEEKKTASVVHATEKDLMSWVKKNPGKTGAIAGAVAVGGWAVHEMNKKQDGKEQPGQTIR